MRERDWQTTEDVDPLRIAVVGLGWFGRDEASTRPTYVRSSSVMLGWARGIMQAGAVRQGRLAKLRHREAILKCFRLAIL